MKLHYRSGGEFVFKCFDCGHVVPSFKLLCPQCMKAALAAKKKGKS